MMDVTAELTDFKNHSMILCAIELWARRLDLAIRLRANGQKVANVVVVSHHIDAEIGLKRRHSIMPIRKELVLVAIQQVDLRIGGNRASILEQNVRLQCVVMVEEAEVISASSLDTNVGVASNPQIAIELDNANPGVLRNI